MTSGAVHRQVTGIITKVETQNHSNQKLEANILISPAFEALKHRVNTRIFQNIRIPDILMTVLGQGLGRGETEKKSSEIIAKIEELMEYETAGDPITGLLWTSLSHLHFPELPSAHK